jgi:hypothetical protein
MSERLRVHRRTSAAPPEYVRNVEVSGSSCRSNIYRSFCSVTQFSDTPAHGSAAIEREIAA